MLEIKTEVEGYTGKEIDLEAHINQVEKEAKKKGAKFKPGEIKQLKKSLKIKDKNHGHKLTCIYEGNFEDLQYEEIDFVNLYEASHKSKDKDKQIEVPIRVTIGVTASLCGYFLSFIPHPAAQGASKFLIASGIAMCVDGTVNRLEEDENNRKNQNGEEKS